MRVHGAMATVKLGHKETGPILANAQTAYARKLEVKHCYVHALHVMQSLHIGSPSHWLNTEEFSNLPENQLARHWQPIFASFADAYATKLLW